MRVDPYVRLGGRGLLAVPALGEGLHDGDKSVSALVLHRLGIDSDRARRASRGPEGPTPARRVAGPCGQLRKVRVRRPATLRTSRSNRPTMPLNWLVHNHWRSNSAKVQDFGTPSVPTYRMVWLSRSKPLSTT